MPEIDVFEKISNAYYRLTTAEKKVADYVIIHQRDTQYMSISELAEACGVAEATISRFTKRLGCKGYNAFKLAMANSIAGRAASMSNPLSGRCWRRTASPTCARSSLPRSWTPWSRPWGCCVRRRSPPPGTC